MRMDSKEIDRLAHNDSSISQMYKGCFPADVFPDLVEKDSFYVINLDTSDKPGSHWCLCFVNAYMKGLWLDSFGRMSAPLKLLKSFSNQHVDLYFNNEQIQSFYTTVCGFYVLHFMINFARGRPLSEILKQFDGDYMSNDRLVVETVSHYFDIPVRPIIDIEYLLQDAQ